MRAAARLAVVAVVAAAVVALGARRDAARWDAGWVDLHLPAMATTVVVTVRDDDRTGEAARLVADACAAADRDLNEWKPDSPLGAVNAAAGGAPVRVPDDLLDLVARSVDIAAATDGAFDPTWAALWGAWDFDAAEPRLPDPDDLARRTALVDHRRVEIDRAAGTLRLPEAGMGIGLGAIAKGWALDRAATALRAAGFDDFLLVAGGQVLAAGDRDGRPWRVGVRDPRGDASDLVATIELRDASASTSGDYERFFVLDGVRHHHVLDPRTGRPARGARSATVVSSDAVLADALSTALLVLGPERGGEVLARKGGWAFLVDADGGVATLGGPAPGFAAEPGR